MKYIITDKFEKKIWILSIIYLAVGLVVGLIFQIVGDTPNISHYPSWWGEAMNTMKIILLVIIALFGTVVVYKGKKIMKQQVKKTEPELEAEEPEKLTKEEEDKKYGL